MKNGFRVLAICASVAATGPVIVYPATAQSKKPQAPGGISAEPKGCSRIPEVYAYVNESNIDLANALSRLDLQKQELEKTDEFEKRKRDAWANISVPMGNIGNRRFHDFFAPIKKTWFKYDVDKEQFWHKPNVGESFLGGGSDTNVFGNGYIASSHITYELKWKPLGTYEGSNAFGNKTTVHVADVQQFALDLPEIYSVDDMGKPKQSFAIPMPRAKLGGSLDDIGVLILGDLRKHGYARITDRQEPTLQLPLDKRMTKHVFFVSPVCAYLYNIKTQTVLAEIPRFGRGWGEF
ncbi:hypothetical protein [Microvirga subterranea]|uniref:Uncharacterized protein n=1 Tax=Microvirga subterranea TaxID=186651 RepID=A0A370H5Z3_9HYPH|nr:hypothetical protein [Microvirga subterranea]RDI51501.1 hypothetical protein DES45_11731 [Microvirga subterranea]